MKTALILVLLAIVAPASAQRRGEAATDELIEKARNAALHYTASLPDFICTQVVQRYEDPQGDNHWSRTDTLTVKLTYFEHLEDYKLVLRDGKPTVLDFMNVGGPTSKGEFGTLLLLIFHPKSEAEFRWKGWGTVHKRRAAVYAYKIDQEHSSYRVSFGVVLDGPDSILAPYHGEVYVDPESGQIVRATQVAEMPANFPITQSTTSIDYDYRDVSGRQYLLPVRAEVRIESMRTLPGIGRGLRRSVKFRGMNEVEFKDFRKFQTESSISFDTIGEKPKPPLEKK
jgi:hypothetical protein